MTDPVAVTADKLSVKVVPDGAPDDDAPISWHLGTLDAGPLGRGGDIPRDLLLTVLDDLRPFESVRWSELANAGGRTFSRNDLGEEARAALVTLGREDDSDFWRLDVTAISHVWGVRNQNVFHLLWLDVDGSSICGGA